MCKWPFNDAGMKICVLCCAGCGFIDTVEKLVSLGADLNARDVTSCTPLQNAAHGTYSALAAMPPPNQPGATLGCLMLAHTAASSSMHNIKKSAF